MNGSREETSVGIRVWAVGSAHGDDQAAWRARDRLAPRLPAGVVCERVAVPLHVLDHMAGTRVGIVIDAYRGDAPPGTITRLEWPSDRLEARGAASTHGFGVIPVLRLGQALGILPERVVLWGIAGAAWDPGGALSPAVADALDPLVNAVLAEVEALARETGGAIPEPAPAPERTINDDRPAFPGALAELGDSEGSSAARGSAVTNARISGTGSP